MGGFIFESEAPLRFKNHPAMIPFGVDGLGSDSPFFSVLIVFL
jgi:hypothetical protein